MTHFASPEVPLDARGYVYLTQELIGSVENVLLFHGVEVAVRHHVPVRRALFHLLMQLLEHFLPLHTTAIRS